MTKISLLHLQSLRNNGKTGDLISKLDLKFMFFKKATEIDEIFTFELTLCKGGFFQKVWCVFLISKINIPNYYPQSWTWNLNFPPITVNNLSKFQAQDIEKHIALSEKKPPLVNVKLTVKILSIFVAFIENMIFYSK